MSFNRIYVSKSVDMKLRNLKARTGLTPNLLCRLGLCLSLNEPGIPDIKLYDEDHEREFNRYTLTGQWDLFFFSLLRERLIEDKLNTESDLETQFKAHLCRGVFLLSHRVKGLDNLMDLVNEAQNKSSQNSIGISH